MISMAVCFASQIALIAGLFQYYMKPDTISIMFQPVSTIYMLITKFICGLILHLALFEKFSKAVMLMKFAMNHEDVFDSPGAAYTVALLQATVNFSVEVLNIAVILMSEDTSSVVMNFVALAIIAEFDDFIYKGGIKEEDQKAFACNEDENAPIKKILTIRHTTSNQCGDDEITEGLVLCVNSGHSDND